MRELLCTYCDQPATTRDHIPPKGLFLSPRPSNLATVPSCESCNRSFSADDQYAHMVLISLYGADAHPTIEPHFAWLERTLRRPQAAGLKQAFLGPIVAASVADRNEAQFEPVDVHFERARINRVIARTAVGLHRIHYSERLVPEYGAFASELNAVLSLPDPVSEMRDYMIDSINSVTATCTPMMWGERDVEIVFGKPCDDNCQSVWRFRCFSGAEFGVWVFPRDFVMPIHGAVYCP